MEIINLVNREIDYKKKQINELNMKQLNMIKSEKNKWTNYGNYLGKIKIYSSYSNSIIIGIFYAILRAIFFLYNRFTINTCYKFILIILLIIIQITLLIVFIRNNKNYNIKRYNFEKLKYKILITNKQIEKLSQIKEYNILKKNNKDILKRNENILKQFTICDISLVKFNNSNKWMIKYIRMFNNISSKEIKMKLKNLPFLMIKDIKQYEAEIIKADLKDYGVSVLIKNNINRGVKK